MSYDHLVNRLLALALAVLVHTLTLAFVAVGLWTAYVNSGLLIGWLFGGLLVAIGWMLRPRLSTGLPADAEVLDRSAAPELYGLAERVADRVGVPRPHRVAVRDLDPRTRYLRTGPRRTPTLTVGLPLWLALSPRQRVTMLAAACAETPSAEEVVVDGALSTLAEWREALLGAAPLRVREEAQTKVTAASLTAEHPGTGYEVAGLLGRAIGRVLGGPVLLVEYVLTRLARSDEGRRRRRREERALRAVPAADLAELEALAAGGRYLAPMQAAALRGESVASIRAGALDRVLPGDGVRTSAPGAQVLGSAESDRIDEELERHYDRAVRGFGLIS